MVPERLDKLSQPDRAAAFDVQRRSRTMHIARSLRFRA